MDTGEAESADSTDSLDQIDRQIIDALVRAREHMGWRHRVQMAEALGMDLSTYNRYEAGERRIPARLLVRVSQVVGVSVSGLLEEPQGGDRPRPEYMARLSRIEKQVDDLTELVQGELLRKRNSRGQTASGN